MTTERQMETTMNTEPQKEHQWLQKWIGEWTYENEASTGADQPLEKATGTETVRSLGEFWVLAEGRGEMPGCGETVTTLMTLGYDPQKQRYVGTWIGSMMAYLWQYEDGKLDAVETTLPLNLKGLRCRVTEQRDTETRSNSKATIIES
jgi:Protein of unknown function (DUF1579)